MSPKHFKIFLSLFFIGFTAFYVYYSADAWFYQDDFSFLWEFRDNTGMQRIFNTRGGFSQFHYITRFLSRNLYWFSLQRIFHSQAFLFYLFNFLIIVFNAYILFHLCRQVFRLKYLPCVASLMYFAGYPTISNFSWLSNSQHLIGHLFVFLFLYISMVENLKPGLRLLFLFLIFLAGIFSNVFFVFVLPGAMLLAYNKVSARQSLAYIAFGLLFILLFVFTYSSAPETSPYSTSLSAGQFISNLCFYAGRMPAVAALSLIILIGIAIITRDRILSAFILLSTGFFIPFAFLVYQKYDNYIALPYIFYLCSLLYVFEKYAKPSIFAIFLVLIAGLNLYLGINSAVLYARKPLGKNVRVFLDEVRQVDLEDYPIVFIRALDSHTNPSRVPLWDIPPFWWHLGRGKAFSYFFENDNRRYRLHKGEDAGYPVITVDDRLGIVDIQYPGG